MNRKRKPCVGKLAMSIALSVQEKESLCNPPIPGESGGGLTLIVDPKWPPLSAVLKRRQVFSAEVHSARDLGISEKANSCSNIA